MLLSSMRMVCDSTYLIDEETMPDTHFNNEEVLVAEPESTIKNNKRSEEIDLSEEIGTTTESAPLESPGTESPQTAEIEQVMNSGLQFLSGLFKMSTGKDMGLENQSIEVNKNTGEVTMNLNFLVIIETNQNPTYAFRRDKALLCSWRTCRSMSSPAKARRKKLPQSISQLQNKHSS